MGHRILIVEDEQGIRSFLEMGLEEEGYELNLAEDGRSGLEAFYEHTPDLLLLDWMLPDMEGTELLKKIRTTNPLLPVIMLTAKDRVQDTVEGLRSGANDYLKKPFSFEELLERIRVQLRNIEPTFERVYGPLHLNGRDRKVHIDELEIKLTPLEFDLLAYLLTDTDKVHRREDIIQAVWKTDANYKSGVLDVFINALRKKLDILDRKSAFTIDTVRGVGYKMSAL